MTIIKEALWSPFYIIVKDDGKLTIPELFQLLKIERYNYKIERDRLKVSKNSLDVLFVIRRKDWIQIMDNWSYTLWHDEGIRNDIRELGKKYEIFCFSVGDMDYSYDFSYYKDGALARKLAVEAMSPKNEVIKENYGVPLNSETSLDDHVEPFNKIIPIAESVGITFRHTIEDIQVYPENKKDLEVNQLTNISRLARFFSLK